MGDPRMDTRAQATSLLLGSLVHVMEVLEHRNQKTLIYTHLTEFENDEWSYTVAKTIEERANLRCWQVKSYSGNGNIDHRKMPNA